MNMLLKISNIGSEAEITRLLGARSHSVASITLKADRSAAFSVYAQNIFLTQLFHGGCVEGGALTKMEKG